MSVLVRGLLPVAALLMLPSLVPGARAADPPPENDADGSQPAVVCREAIVSPVSGFAECVDPRGAPVAPAPPRPDPECPRQSAPCTDPPPKSVEQNR